MENLYRLARQDGFGTLPTSLGKPWQVQQNSWCSQDCMPAYDFMKFGGHRVFDGNGYAEGWTCADGSPPSEALGLVP